MKVGKASLFRLNAESEVVKELKDVIRSYAAPMKEIGIIHSNGEASLKPIVVE